MHARSTRFTIMSILTGGLVAALTLSSCDEGETGTETSTPDDVQRETIGLADAIKSATEEVSGVVVEAEFETGKNGSVFEIEIFADGEVHEVYIDPSDGRVLRTKTDPEDLKSAQKAVKVLEGAGVTLAEAIAAAEREGKGTAFAMDIDDGVYDVRVMSGDRTLKIEIAVADGTVAAVTDRTRRAEERQGGEDDDDEHDDDDDDEHEGEHEDDDDEDE